jgi:hypothetical protein
MAHPMRSLATAVVLASAVSGWTLADGPGTMQPMRHDMGSTTLLALAPPADRPHASEPPEIPFGYDAFTSWDRWPYLRIGVRAYMRATFDREGGNHNVDAAHFLRQVDDGQGGLRGVVLDEAGPGILWFVRHNHWHGSPWTYTVDGHSEIVQESSTRDPLNPVAHSVFLPERLFPPGLTWTWSTTKGADLSWVPIPFERALSLEYGRALYGTGYFLLWKVMPGARLSRPLASWDRQPPPRDVTDLLARSGTDIAPHGSGTNTVQGSVSLRAHETRTLAVIDRAPSVIRRLAFRFPESSADAATKARLRVFWDGRPSPSIDAPLSLFFGTASLMRAPEQTAIVTSFPMSVRCEQGTCELASYFPMPFHRTARIELAETQGQPIREVRWEVRTMPYRDPPNWVGLFHATYRDFSVPERGRDLILLDTRETEGGGEWCGHVVGTTYAFTRTATLNTLEGDPRFFLDDSLSPQGQGTGSEEWGGGGDFWGGRVMSLPFVGKPVGKPPTEAKNDLERWHSAYRFLLSDLLPFGRNARVTLEHGAENMSTEHYDTVTYWYGLNRSCLALTDAMDVGDVKDEELHAYRSDGAGERVTLASRFELGPDRLPISGGGWPEPATGSPSFEVFPPVSDDGRRTRGATEFTLQVQKDNVGVMLRRRLDLAYPNQKARVLIMDDGASGQWREAGIWYTAGGNTVVFGDPRATAERGSLTREEFKRRHELSRAATIVETSNRRWREDEFLIPRVLTEGRERIRVRLEFLPVSLSLHPGARPIESAWTEFRYWAYCLIVPK